MPLEGPTGPTRETRSFPLKRKSTNRVRRSRALIGVAGLASTAVLLASCGSSSAGSNSAAPSATNPTTIVLDYTLPAGSATTNYYVEEGKLFEKAHPHVKVVVHSITFQQMQASSPLILSGSNAPSLYYDNQGYGAIYKLAQDHLILPLTTYERKYGWAAATHNSWLLSFDGEVSLSKHEIGTGTLYGVSNALEPMGIFYNRGILRKIGQQPPTSLSQFVSDMALAKKAGYIPFSIGGQVTAYDLGELWGLVAGSLATSQGQVDYLRKLELGNPSASWTAPIVAKAAQTIADWQKKGYFPAGVLAVSQSAAQNFFLSGKSLFHLNYSVVASIFAPMKSNAGFFLLPSNMSGRTPAPIMVGNQPWTIPTKGPHHALAAEFLNFALFNKASGTRYFKMADAVAIDTPVSALNGANPLARAVAESTLAAEHWSTDLGYPGDNTPDSLNLINQLLQEVISGKLSSQQFGQQMESDFKNFEQSLQS